MLTINGELSDDNWYVDRPNPDRPPRPSTGSSKTAQHFVMGDESPPTETRIVPELQRAEVSHMLSDAAREKQKHAGERAVWHEEISRLKARISELEEDLVRSNADASELSEELTAAKIAQTRSVDEQADLQAELRGVRAREVA